MDEIEIETVGNPDLQQPILIEGLPGVGYVGNLVAEHLVDQFDSELVRVVYSNHLPPQVSVNSEGSTTLARSEFHAITVADRDVLVLLGDYQASDMIGHYRLTDSFIDIAESFGVTEVIALGGMPTGELDHDYGVIGAVSDPELRNRYEAVGVEFRPNEPAGGIVGTSGLLVGLGARRGIPSVCLMGETSGYVVDPKSAQAVLLILQQLLEFEIDPTSLEERAAEMEEVIREFEEMGQPASSSDEDLRYFD